MLVLFASLCLLNVIDAGCFSMYLFLFPFFFRLICKERYVAVLSSLTSQLALVGQPLSDTQCLSEFSLLLGYSEFPEPPNKIRNISGISDL